MKKSLYYTGVVGGSLVAALGFTGMMGEAIVARNKPEPVRIYSPPDPSAGQAYEDFQTGLSFGVNWGINFERTSDVNTLVSTVLGVDLQKVEDCREFHGSWGGEEVTCSSPHYNLNGNPSELARDLSLTFSHPVTLALCATVFVLGLAGIAGGYLSREKY
ncbi:MAG TPA: hypothetical protein VJG49_00365 [Candidatus Nanoarchaeia archaeon]|nr:hypothetical protein [Candidatus Nanoarchaeia archaeon]